MSMLVIGEALIDVIYERASASANSSTNASTTAGTAEVKSRQPGGSPLNIAVGLARLGREVQLLSSIGTDAAGQTIQKYCAAENIAIYPESFNSHPTSLAHAHLGANKSATYTFELNSNYPKPPTAPRARAQLQQNAPKLIHFGSLAAHHAQSYETVREWLKLFHGYSSVSYDPNVRLDLVGPKERVDQQLREFLPFIEIFKASTEDLAAIYPTETPAEIAQRFLTAGGKLFVVTDGGDGLELFTREHRVKIPAISVEVVDTVGAGDSLMSALIDGLARMSLLGRCNQNALANISRAMLVSLGAFAATAASITVCRQGANPPTRKEIATQSELYSVGAL